MTKKTRRARARRALLTLSLVLVVAFAAVGGTIAWLTASTAVVTNTFSPSGISVSLTETGAVEKDGAFTNSYQIVPGCNISKDPKVSASADVPYYVFVKLTEKNWPAWTDADDSTKKLVSYTVAQGWTELTDASISGYKVYYKDLAADAALTNEPVITNNTIYVSEKVTKEQLDDLKNTLPEVTVQAYAIQKASSSTSTFKPLEAWNNVSQ